MITSDSTREDVLRGRYNAMPGLPEPQHIKSVFATIQKKEKYYDLHQLGGQKMV